MSDTPSLPGLVAGYTSTNNPFGLPIKTINEKDVMCWNPAFEWTGGGVITNSSDLARWEKMLYEGKVMSSHYLDEMLEKVAVGKDDFFLRLRGGHSDKTAHGPGMSIMVLY